MLTAENYAQGYLINGEFLGGVSADPEHEGCYLGFVVSYVSGEYCLYESYSDLSTAITHVNDVPFTWSFEFFKPECQGGCSDGSTGCCSENGKSCCSDR